MKKELEGELRSMVQQYGYSRVARVLEGMEQTEGDVRHCLSKSDDSTKSKPISPSTRRSASAYAAKLELPPETRSMIIELASRFEAKTFVPTIGDVRNFFRFYGMDGGQFKSRTAAMGRIFKVLASMDGKEIKRILDDQLFSGPARLEPIADAIRRASQ